MAKKKQENIIEVDCPYCEGKKNVKCRYCHAGKIKLDKNNFCLKHRHLHPCPVCLWE